MRKLFSTLVLTAAVLFTMTACLEEETSAIDVTGTATIKGVVFLDNDVTSDGDGNERANGAIVRVTYDAGDLDVNNDGDYRPVVLETTADAQGAYSIEVPTSPNTMDFSITVDDFETTYTFYDGVEDENVTVDAVYDFGSTSVNNVKIGETRVTDLYLDDKYIYYVE